MTNKEIVKRYLDADGKKAQIEILADLNGTNTETIKKILSDEGVLKKPGPKGPRKLKAIPATDSITKRPAQSTSVPTVLRDAAHLGIELINIRITEKEKEIKEATEALADLKRQRTEILQTIHNLHPDNDGNLWYYGDNGRAVVVNE